jgi:hypothetical protein
MLRLFQAGLVAACIQLTAVALATFAVSLLVQQGLFASVPVISFLKWTYLLMAVAVALTSHRYIDCTATHIRHAARLLHPTEPNRAANFLLSELSFAAICFAILTFRTAPETLVEAGRYLGCTCVASIAWPGMMSIGTASFGANAQAAGKAL